MFGACINEVSPVAASGCEAPASAWRKGSTRFGQNAPKS
jgi:hypothetical protein